MLKLGTVGNVRFCIKARFDVYGESGGASAVVLSSGGGGDTVGPCAGPLIGPVDAAGSLRGAGPGRGCGAGATSERVSVNSILVAIKALRVHLCALHLT